MAAHTISRILYINIAEQAVVSTLDIHIGDDEFFPIGEIVLQRKVCVQRIAVVVNWNNCARVVEGECLINSLHGVDAKAAFDNNGETFQLSIQLVASSRLQ